MFVEWLAPLAVFWMVGAMYLGGAPITFEGGGGVRQMGGLVVSFILYMAAWAGLRALLAGPVGEILAIVLATIAVTVALPLVCRVGFRVLGVRIRSASSGHGGAH